MKRFLLIAMLCVPAFGQSYYQNNAYTTTYINGTRVVNVIQGASVRICSNISGSCVQQPVYLDQGLTVELTQPLALDGSGNFGFWVEAGTYSYRILNSQGVQIQAYPFTTGGGGGGGGNCGPLSIDPTSTDCGNDNLFGTGTHSQIFGYTEGLSGNTENGVILNGTGNDTPTGVSFTEGAGPIVANGLNNFNLNSISADLGDTYAFGNENFNGGSSGGTLEANTVIAVGLSNVCAGNFGTAHINDSYFFGETLGCYSGTGSMTMSNIDVSGDSSFNLSMGTGTDVYTDITGGGDTSIQLGINNANDTSSHIVAWGDGTVNGNNIHDIDAGGDAACGFIENSFNIFCHGTNIAADLTNSSDVFLGGWNILGTPSSGNTGLTKIIAIGANLMPDTGLNGLTNIVCLANDSTCETSNQTTLGNSSTTSLLLFGCPSGQSVSADGSGTCYTPGSGSGGSVGTAGQLQMVGSTAGSFAASHATDNGSLFAITEPASIASAGASQWGFTYNATPIVPGSSTTFVIGANSSGQGVMSEAGGPAERICDATNGVCAGSSFITSLTTTGSSGAATVTSGVLNIPVYAGGGSTAWSSLTNPTTNLALGLGTNTTTFTGGLAMLTGAYEQQNTWTVGSVNVPAIYQNFRTGFGQPTEYSSIGDEFSLAVPSSSTTFEVDGIGAYETCDSAATICIPLSTTVVREVANTNVEAANFNSWDNNLGGADFFGVEIDTLAQNAGTSGEMMRFLPWVKSLSNPFYGLHLLTAINGSVSLTTFLQTDNLSAVNFASIGESSSTGRSENILFTDGTTASAMWQSGGTLNYNKGVAIGSSGQMTVSSVGATVVPSLTIGSLSGCLLGTSGVVSAGCTLSNIAAGTAGSGTYDFSGATQLKLPVAAGYVSAANGEVGYDSTNKNFHAWVNGADTLLVPVPTTFTSGDCGQPTSSGGTWIIADAGGPCGTSGGGAAWSAVTAGTNSATLLQSGSLAPTSSGVIAANELGPVGGLVPFCTGFTPTNGQNLQYTTGSSPNPCYTASSGTGTSVTAAPPYEEIGSTFYIPSDGMSTATKPTTFSSGCTFSATWSWINSVTPSGSCTNGTNGNQILTNSTSATAWAQQTASIASVEAVFNIGSTGILNSADFSESGIWIYDSTNGKIYLLISSITSGTLTSSTFSVAFQIYNCTSPCTSTNPAFSSTVSTYAMGYGGGAPTHFKLSVSGTTLTAFYSLDGGQTFTAFPTTETVGTITKSGYMIANAAATANIMSIKVQ